MQETEAHTSSGPTRGHGDSQWQSGMTVLVEKGACAKAGREMCEELEPWPWAGVTARKRVWKNSGETSFQPDKSMAFYLDKVLSVKSNNVLFTNKCICSRDVKAVWK